MYVRSLSIQNLRSFESAELPLCYPGSKAAPTTGSVPHLDNVTLLLGNNGAGKTTVLRAVALSTLAPVLAMGSGYVPYALVRRIGGKQSREGQVEAQVVLQAQDGMKEGEEEAVKASLVAPKRGYTDRFVMAPKPPHWQFRLYEEEESPSFLVLGYGATRRVETGPGSVESRAKERVLRYRRVAGLFEEHMTLMSLSAWLPRVKDRKRQQEVVGLMNKLLPDTELLKKWGDPENPECLFRRGGSVLPYPALSDGYRAFICWMGDLLYHLHTICPKGKHLVDMSGVVLVDEVDLHLHPEWQRHLVPSLSSTLPRLQFILTSHSPIVVGTLSSQNVLLLTEQEQQSGVRSTRVERPGEELYGLSADQILTSESFGLESTRDERFFDRLKEVAGQAREGGAEDALRFMRMVAGGAAAESAPTYIAAEREPMVLRGHENEVRAVTWSPEGQVVASSGNDGTVRLWDAESGRMLRSLEGHSGSVWSVSFSPDGRLLASSGKDGTVRLWDAKSGRTLRSLEGHSGSVWSVSFSPDGRRLASSGGDGTVRLWDAESGRTLHYLEGHKGRVWSVSFSPDGRRLASSGEDGTVRLWDAESGRTLRSLKGHSGSVWSVSFSPDGRRLASSGGDFTVRLWDAKSGRTLRCLEGHQDSVWFVSFSPDGRRLASSGGDGTVLLWDAASGRTLRSLEGHTGRVLSVSFSPNGRRLASSGRDGTVRLWDFLTTEPLTISDHRKKPVQPPATTASNTGVGKRRKTLGRQGNK